MSKNRPTPRHFLYEEDFVSAAMDFAVNSLPQVTPFDGYAEAQAKRAALAQAREDAREDAREEWANWLENMVETYERGLGPAWA